MMTSYCLYRIYAQKCIVHSHAFSSSLLILWKNTSAKVIVKFSFPSSRSSLQTRRYTFYCMANEQEPYFKRTMANEQDPYFKCRMFIVPLKVNRRRLNKTTTRNRQLYSRTSLANNLLLIDISWYLLVFPISLSTN